MMVLTALQLQLVVRMVVQSYSRTRKVLEQMLFSPFRRPRSVCINMIIPRRAFSQLVNFTPMDSVLAIVLVLVVNFPPGSRENVLVPFVPSPLDNLQFWRTERTFSYRQIALPVNIPCPCETPGSYLASVSIFFLLARIINNSNVIMNVKVEQGARLPPSFGGDEVIEAVVVWDNEILFDIHKHVGADVSKVVKLQLDHREEFAYCSTHLAR
mmetsp:Transcript_26495/g.103232  ORF Transcript_26495/g.103232 Transcript_26495/m.103232 type:complete len:212 (-) Transcript_26495:856-1491(-)